MKTENTIKKIALILCGILIMAFITGCSNDNNDEATSDPLIGTWESDYGYCKMSYTFRSDGTGRWTRTQSDGKWYSDYKYTVLAKYTLYGVVSYKIKTTTTATNAQNWGDEKGYQEEFRFVVSNNTAKLNSIDELYYKKN